MLHIGMLLFPALTQLDLTGPFEVFCRIPNAKVHLLWKDMNPVFSDSGLGLLPSSPLGSAPALDVLFVPGGDGVTELLSDEEVLDFVSERGANARYVTSVCTGSLLLGAAGLLRGFRAATHWAYMDLLPLVGATPVVDRVVVDRNRVTAGGVTAGIDFGLRMFVELAGEKAAKRAQLMLEYDPSPPFQAGHPRHVDPREVEVVKKALSERFEKRKEKLVCRVRGGSWKTPAHEEDSRARVRGESR